MSPTPALQPPSERPEAASSDDPRAPVLDRVGIRELRQHLSRYLQRVAEGESLTVTDRGEPVAILGPLPKVTDPVERLVAEGRLERARLDLVELGLPERSEGATSISDALGEERDERL